LKVYKLRKHLPDLEHVEVVCVSRASGRYNHSLLFAKTYTASILRKCQELSDTVWITTNNLRGEKESAVLKQNTILKRLLLT